MNYGIFLKGFDTSYGRSHDLPEDFLTVAAARKAIAEHDCPNDYDVRPLLPAKERRNNLQQARRFSTERKAYEAWASRKSYWWKAWLAAPIGSRREAHANLRRLNP